MRSIFCYDSYSNVSFLNYFYNMNEYSSFCVSNMKNICRACLLNAEDVIPMSLQEVRAYKTFTDQELNMNSNLYICTICRWMLKKFMKFSNQCQRANLMLNDMKMESTSYIYLDKLKLSYDIKITNLESHYFGPDYGLDDDKCDVVMTDDHHIDDDDDDEVPLVMFKDDGKRKSKKSRHLQRKQDQEIKREQEIKHEEGLQIQDSCKKKSAAKKNKQLKDGFSSRMVQETDEYTVIKLTKEQVIQEMFERAKSEAYVRAPFKCEKCVKGFNFEDVLKSHMDKHTMDHGAYKCEMCNQYCPNTVSLRGHIKSHTTRYKCKLCGQVRLSRQHLLEHHAITHTNAATAYKCDKCQFTTNKRTVIQRHVKSHATSEHHACHRCGKLFKTIESLRVHTMRHDKTSRVRCGRCDKQFIYPSLLHKHVAAVHERDDYYCVECDVKFKSPESLRLHFKKAKRHRDSSSYKHQCPHCDQRFVTPSTLSVHLTRTHGAAQQYGCAVCARRYSSRDAARAHAWRAHGHARDQPECQLCGKTFSRKSLLKVHLRTHTQRPALATHQPTIQQVCPGT